ADTEKRCEARPVRPFQQPRRYLLPFRRFQPIDGLGEQLARTRLLVIHVDLLLGSVGLLCCAGRRSRRPGKLKAISERYRLPVPWPRVPGGSFQRDGAVPTGEVTVAFMIALFGDVPLYFVPMMSCSRSNIADANRQPIRFRSSSVAAATRPA